MIPLFSSSAANAGLDFNAPIQRVLASQWYILGEEVKSFEREFAQYVGVADCVSLANGTDALELALRTVGVKAGDKVVTVANAGFYSSIAIHSVGAVPLYVDVDAGTLTLSAEMLRQALDHKPKAVIVTHLYGQLADIKEIVKIARAAGVAVIEDCAQSHGAVRDGKQAGSFGDISCFSFYPTKNLGALGDGGAVASDNAALMSKSRTFRQYGWSKKYHVDTAGGCNSRLDEIQAAILRVKLPHLDSWNASRRSIATRYNSAFANLPMTLPSIGSDYVAHLYVVRVQSRDAFRQHMESKGVSTDVHYPIPDHLQKAYPEAKTLGSLTNTEAASSSIVTLPCFPNLPAEQVDQVISAVQSFFKK
ncbi:MAG: DegT/DnrJ/EryC1/StrS family aminotransferase [Proteobacteria bacterium]|nr:MAG: DegT/DnrJ/EryC1/StrS family aminotransferase [Pseudomonadota bacterium]